MACGQVGNADWDHLGKLIGYATALRADIAVRGGCVPWSRRSSASTPMP